MGAVLRYISREFMTLATMGFLGFYALTGISPQPLSLLSSGDSFLAPIVSMLPIPQKAEKAVSEKIAMVGKPFKMGSFGGHAKSKGASSYLVAGHGPIFLN